MISEIDGVVRHGGIVKGMRKILVVPDEGALRERLLDGHRDQLCAELDEMEGKVEITIKGVYEESAILREIVAGDPQIARLRAQTAGKPEAAGYYERIRAVCDRHEIVMISDEVVTGFGRTGRNFGIEHWNVEPDIICTAKALSGGYVPVGAVITRPRIMDSVFNSMERCVVHSNTFGQNDMAMAAALASLYVIEEDKLVENAAAKAIVVDSDALDARIIRHLVSPALAAVCK